MYRIGIDLGGTNIAVGVVNDGFEIVSRISVPTGADRPAEQVIRDMGDAVETVCTQLGIEVGECISIGIGSPGNCNSETGVVVRAYNLGWFDIPVCKMLEDRFHIPVHLSNDANCAALAETVAGNAIGCKNMIMVTLGTGVGGGIIIDGKIYAGMRSAGAEVGHMLLVLDGEPCTCGRNGCWEAYASATALIRQGRRAAEENPDSILAKKEIKGAIDVMKAEEEGCPVAKRVVDRYCEYVAAGLTDMVNGLAPEMILLGGGVANNDKRILDPIREYVETHCFGQREGAIPIIKRAKLGNEAGIIGAAAL